MAFSISAATIALAALFLAACAQIPSTKEKLDRRLGKSEDQIIAEFGIPDRSHATDTARYLTYDFSESSTTITPGRSEQYYCRTAAYCVTTRPATESTTFTYTYSCEVTFIVKGGTVSAWDTRGDSCDLQLLGLP